MTALSDGSVWLRYRTRSAFTPGVVDVTDVCATPASHAERQRLLRKGKRLVSVK